MKRHRIQMLSVLLASAVFALAINLNAQTVTFSFTNINSLGAAETDANAINKKGTIAGSIINSAGQRKAVLIQGTKSTVVSCPNGAPSAFYGINLSGSAVADDYCGNGIVWVYVPGHGWVPRPQPGCPDCPFVSLGLSDSEVVIGYYQNANQQIEGFTLDLNTNVFTPLTLPLSQRSEPVPQPWGINKSGVAVLNLVDPASGLSHSYQYEGGAFTLIDVPNALQSWAHGINNNGDIVYTAEDASGGVWGVLFSQELHQYYWFNQPDGRDNTRAFGITDETITTTGNTVLKLVGEYSPIRSTKNLAYEATVTIKP